MERITARLPAFEEKPGKLRDQKKQTDKQKTQNTCLFVFFKFQTEGNIVYVLGVRTALDSNAHCSVLDKYWTSQSFNFFLFKMVIIKMVLWDCGGKFSWIVNVRCLMVEKSLHNIQAPFPNTTDA